MRRRPTDMRAMSSNFTPFPMIELNYDTRSERRSLEWQLQVE